MQTVKEMNLTVREAVVHSQSRYPSFLGSVGWNISLKFFFPDELGLNKEYVIWKDEAKPKWWPIDIVYRDTTKLRKPELTKALQALQRCKLNIHVQT